MDDISDRRRGAAAPHSSVSPDMMAWCLRIPMLSHIEVNLFCESFSDGVLFLYLAQHLFPKYSREAKVLTDTILPAVNFNDKLSNWRKVNDGMLSKLKLERSDWFLSYLARGKDGYIQDLLEDIMKMVPEPPVDSQHYEHYGHQSYPTTTTHNFSSYGYNLVERDPHGYGYNYNNTAYHRYDNDRYQQTYQHDDDVDNHDDRLLREEMEPPVRSFYLTPLDTEQDSHSHYERYLDREETKRSPRFARQARKTTSYDSYRQAEEERQQNQRLRQIQRNGNYSFYRRKTWRKPFMRYRTYNNFNRYGYRHQYQRQHHHRFNNRSYHDYNASAAGSSKTENWNTRTQQFFTNVEPYSRPQRVTQQQKASSDMQSSTNEAEYLNQRFNYYHNRAYGYNEKIRYSKYFYKYYLQYPVSCNTCIDNNLTCRCPRFGLDYYYQGTQIW